MAMPKPPSKPSVEATAQSLATKLEAELSAVRQMTAAMATIRKVKLLAPDLFERFKPEFHAVIDEEPSEQKVETDAPDESDPERNDYGIGRLMAWFRNRNNEAATLKQMAKEVGINEKTIKSIIYNRHKGKIVSTDQRGRNNRAYFRMAE